MSCSKIMRSDAVTSQSLTSPSQASKLCETKERDALCLQPPAIFCVLVTQKFCALSISLTDLTSRVFIPPHRVKEEKSTLTRGSFRRTVATCRVIYSAGSPHRSDSISLLVGIPPLRGGFIARHSVTPGSDRLRGSGDQASHCPSNS
jgi:hypothetical protein